MKKYVIWKTIGEVSTHSDTYITTLSVIEDEAQIVINSLEDSKDWGEVDPIDLELKRWENKKGDRIFISEQP